MPVSRARLQDFHGAEKDRRSRLHEDSRTRRDVMLDAGALIAKYRSGGVLVDSNLLVLLLVGSVNKQRILDFKRTQDFN